MILGNPTMIAAYRAGIPGNGKAFPDGAKMAKIQWKPKKSTEAPFSVNVPDTLADLFFIEKDSKRFPDSGGWGYAQFDYDPASDTSHRRQGRHSQLRTRVPYRRGDEGLHFPPISEAMSGRTG